MKYNDFELAVSSNSSQSYDISVLRSPGGDARSTMIFPFSQDQLSDHLKDLQIALLRSSGKYRRFISADEETVQKLGAALFDSLISGEIRSCYDVSRRESARDSRGLRLKLRFQDDAPELAFLPWEFMYDAREAEYVCLSRNISIVRYLETAHPLQSLLVQAPLRVLVMLANPTDLDILDSEAERLRIEQATASLRSQGIVELVWMKTGSWRELQTVLRRGPWHVLHFIGHGAFDRGIDEGVLLLTDDNGLAQPLAASQIGRLLADHLPLRLVVLNACEGAKGSQQDISTGIAATLIRRGIPSVLAMQYEISDHAAIEFTRTFYEALADELPVDRAVADARKAIGLAISNSFEWGIPVLFMRTIDAQLFDIGSKRVQVESEPQLEPEMQTDTPDLEQVHFNPFSDENFHYEKQAPSQKRNQQIEDWARSLLHSPTILTLQQFMFRWIAASMISAIFIVGGVAYVHGPWIIAAIGTVQWLFLHKRWSGLALKILAASVALSVLLAVVYSSSSVEPPLLDFAVRFFVGGIMGAGIGVPQWFLIRNCLSQSFRWNVNSAIAFGLWFSIMTSIDRLVTYNNNMTSVLVAAFLGLLVGTGQWLVIRRNFLKSENWILASGVGSALGMGTIMVLANWGEGPILFLIGMIPYASITGLVIYHILQHPDYRNT